MWSSPSEGGPWPRWGRVSPPNADHLPLYRQSQIYARGGVDLDRSTQATWCGKVGFHLAPVVDRMVVHLRRSTRLFMEFAGDRGPGGAA